jgi:hypothetical protein
LPGLTLTAPRQNFVVKPPNLMIRPGFTAINLLFAMPAPLPVFMVLSGPIDLMTFDDAVNKFHKNSRMSISEKIKKILDNSPRLKA